MKMFVTAAAEIFTVRIYSAAFADLSAINAVYWF